MDIIRPQDLDHAYQSLFRAIEYKNFLVEEWSRLDERITDDAARLHARKYFTDRIQQAEDKIMLLRNLLDRNLNENEQLSFFELDD